MKFPLPALCKIVFFWETTIKSHEISSLCSLQYRFLGGGETIIKATASWSICSWLEYLQLANHLL